RGGARPDRGRIALDGRILFDAHFDVPAEDRRLGYVPQDYALFPHLDGLGNVAFGLAGLPRRERRARAAAWHERMGASHLAHRRVGALSGGERQRLALTRPLARASPAEQAPAGSLGITVRKSTTHRSGIRVFSRPHAE